MSNKSENSINLSGSGSFDPSAYHYDVEGEFTRSPKRTSVSLDDNMLLENSDGGLYAKNYVQIKDIPAVGKVVYDQYSGLTQEDIMGALSYWEPLSGTFVVDFPELTGVWFRTALIVTQSDPRGGRIKFYFGPQNRLLFGSTLYAAGVQLETYGLSGEVSSSVLTAMFPDPNNPTLCYWVSSDRIGQWEVNP